MLNTTALTRIGVVVSNLDKALVSYAEIYGITSWTLSETTTIDALSYGRKTQRTPGVWRSAIGYTTPHHDGDETLCFELIQPLSGESPFHEYLRTKREGICFIQVQAEGEGTVAQHFAALDIPCVYQARVDGHTRCFYDTRAQLGGFLVEMVTADSPLLRSDSASGRRVELSPSSAFGLLPAQKMYHFGVLVHDVMQALPHYRDIFGITSFDCKTWEKGFGRLDDPQYRGTKVDHGYFTAQGFAGNFGFEIIQCNHGPSHYNREFFDIRGPGIHHVFTTLAHNDLQWEENCGRMADAGYPLCMGSTLRGQAAEFGYFDTFNALGGYLIEAVIRRRQALPEFQAPDWVVDFEELT
ncbi:MAG: VOC family protein [Corynebacterium sp.]|uniref:VOC family protein n=1 Tax=Corynebacterium sp. TaxID=1720 RepID=UPI0026DCA40B|nr:VOC family protein [Corynebacterium sp.]MDO4761633.1 VOC family protein [Corynebacterium sp.]